MALMNDAIFRATFGISPAIHYELSQHEHAAVSEAKRNGGQFDRPEMRCRSGDGHARGTRFWRFVTCPTCLERIDTGR